MFKPALPLIRQQDRHRVMIWGALVFALVYVGLGVCPLGEPSYMPLTQVDRALPLLPWTLIFYFSDYVFILWVLLRLQDRQDFNAAYYRMIAGIVLSFAVFLIFPTVYPRPDLPADPFWADVFSFLHFLDRPTNCFPSLHVSMTLIAAASLTGIRPLGRWLGYGWALAICLSTLTTKQHYAVDVLGGMFITMASLVLTARVQFRDRALVVSKKRP